MSRRVDFETVLKDKFFYFKSEEGDVAVTTATEFGLRRESEDIGYSCQWHILCARQGPVNSVLSKKATTELEVLSRQKNISISSNAQKKVMILMHL